MRQYTIETKRIMDRDESRHWGNHPLAINYSRANKNHRHHRANRTNYYFARLLRTRIYKVLMGLMKAAPTLELLGCNIDQFKLHLQSKFNKTMTWKNYGSHWHIDHIEPCASFDLSQPSQQRICFHYTNMQPLEANKNWSKHSTLQPTQRQLLM